MDYLLNLISPTISTNTNFVLNLIINGLPSKHKKMKGGVDSTGGGFKPYYKWTTF